MTTNESLRHLIARGKVPRKPNLDVYDSRTPIEPAAVVVAETTNNHLYADADRTWARDKALLVALGVDGDVPFGRAARNSGLTAMGMQRGVKFANKTGLWRIIPANDNHEIAAKAA